MISIAADLDGKRIAITGGTGFLGTALIERLLRSVPGCELVLLIRAGQRRTVDQRAKREIFKNDAFDRLRTLHGGENSESFDEMIARRVTTIGGDVSTDGLGLDDDGRAALRTCDIVIHSAATVSFDSPLDHAVEVNLLGPSRIAATLHQLFADAPTLPHLVAVSTCYVAGNRKGSAPEQPVDESPYWFGLDWRDEVAAARRARADAEAESRKPPMLEGFRADARKELGAAGTPLLAAKTEQYRSRWVSDQLVDAGRSRAASLGWPDAYAYTKALGEKALFEQRGDLPVSIVRPAIIESSLAEPTPGWIRGFRMAEPVIISYARGLLKEFPGVPEGIIDVIPVDLVCGAICVAAAAGPARNDDGSLARPRIVQSASGSANPLRYRKLVDNVRAWFTEHPVYDNDGQPIVVPEWNFPGRGRVQAQLERAKTILDRTESVLQSLPLRGKQAEWASNIEEKKEEAERALTYVELYGAYAECEAVYGVTELLSLWEQCDQTSQETFGFDPRVIDWDRYVSEIHLPSVVKHARVKTTPGATDRESRSSRLRRQVLHPDRHVVAFDLENTLIASNVVASYSWLATRRLPTDERLRFVARTLAEAPSLLSLDRKDRSDFLRHFYRRYEGADAAQLHADTVEMASHLLLTKSFPAAIYRVRAHRKLGHRTLLITGALRVAIEPLVPLFDDVICAEMAVGPDGTLTGELTDVPPTGETRAQALLDYCEAHGFDPAESVAYADSTSDLPLLEAAGFPVAVNPEARLAALARKRGWLVEHFEKSKGGSDPLLPLAPDVARAAAVEDRPMKALEFSRKPARYAAAMVAGALRPGAGASVGPLRLRDLDPVALDDPTSRPSAEWVTLRPRLAGICGSDLSTIDGHSSRYFEPIVSFPFVPGHEVVGDLEDGRRAVLIPVLHCAVRGIDPVCPACAAEQINRCERIAFGHLEPGLQSGFCCDTGGGWSEEMIAHPDQLVAVPDGVSDEAAVMVEPTACAVHAAAMALSMTPVDGPVVVIGAGTLGLLTMAALDRADVVVAARYPHQKRLAKELGASRVVGSDELGGAIRLATGSMMLGAQLTGGAPTVVDCVGSEASLAQALEIVAPGGTVIVVGMPATTTLDLTGLWHREVALRGCYAYTRDDFETALQLVETKDLGRLVTQTYPLARYTDAIAHAAEAGRRGATKIAFDMRKDR